jgi:anti-sigma-K factor RskA
MREDIKFVSRACPEYEALLEDYLAGDLNSVDARRASAHLETCAACRSALDNAVASVRLLKMADMLTGEAPQPAPGFARAVMARISGEERHATAQAGFWQPFVSLAWRFAATATLALAILLVYAAGWHGRPEANPAVAEETQIGSIFTPETPSVPANRDEILIMVAESDHGND